MSSRTIRQNDQHHVHNICFAVAHTHYILGRLYESGVLSRLYSPAITDPGSATLPRCPPSGNFLSITAEKMTVARASGGGVGHSAYRLARTELAECAIIERAASHALPARLLSSTVGASHIYLAHARIDSLCAPSRLHHAIAHTAADT